MTAQPDMPICSGEISNVRTPSRTATSTQWLPREGESVFSREVLSDRLPNPK